MECELPQRPLQMSGPCKRHSLPNRGENIVDAFAVSRLRAVAIGHQEYTIDGMQQEHRHKGAELRVRLLSGPDDVDLAQRRHVDAVESIELRALLLLCDLRHAAGRDRLLHRPLGLG